MRASYRSIFLGVLLLGSLVVTGLAVAPFLPALLWAVSLAILTYPLYRRWSARGERHRALKDGRNETVASLGAVLSTFLFLCLPVVLIGVGLSLQLRGVSDDVARTTDPGGDALRQIDKAVQPLAERFGSPDFKVSTYVEEHRDELVQAVRAPAGRFAGQALFTVLTLVIALLTQFFMLRDGHRLLPWVLELSPLPPDRTKDILDRIAETVRAVFVGTVLVAILQGAMMGVAFGFVGVPNALLLGVISAVLCIIPLLGAPVLYLPIGAAFLLRGDVKGALIIWGVGLLIVSNIDNALKPFLIGGRANLHPMAIFFAILGGVLLVGPIGVMAGPMGLTLVIGLAEALRDLRRGELDAPQPST